MAQSNDAASSGHRDSSDLTGQYLEGVRGIMSRPQIPALSPATVEALVVAVFNLKTVGGLRIVLPLEWVLTPALLAQLPETLKKR